MNTENLKAKLEKLLEEYNYSYSDHALNKIINKWNEQKEPLRNILRKHPRWVEEEDMIVFDIDMKREPNTRVAVNFMMWAMDVLGIDCPDPESMWKGYNFPCDQFVTENMAYRVNRDYPDFKMHVGQKTSRVMNKLFCQLGLDKHPDYNREFAKYADALNPLKITRHTVISINLLDFLTMSFGNSWASCHTIDKGNKRGMPNNYTGCYSSGTLSYALDQTSMVFYTIDSKFNGTEFYFEPKMNRQMFHFGEEKLVQGRLYPQSCDTGAMDEYTQFRNIMQEIVALGLGVPNLWTLKRGTMACKEATWTDGTHYADYHYFENCTVSILKGSDNENKMTVGADPICIECGYAHDNSDSINCCRSGYKCANCGCNIDEDDAHYIDGEWYCDDCSYWCEDCGEYHIYDNVTWVESVERYVCDDCLDSYYSQCEYCGKYYPEDDGRWVDSEDGWVCEDCIDEHFCKCAECYEYHRLENARYVDSINDYVCDDCFETHYATCEECGEDFHMGKMVEINECFYCRECAEQMEEEEDENESEAV